LSVGRMGYITDAGTGRGCHSAGVSREDHAADVRSGPGADLYWLPLGAGGYSVRLNGRVFEAVEACVQHRRIYDLYHAALEVRFGRERFVVEQCPIPDAHGDRRGVVLEGAVGLRWAGRARIFRYEVRRWRDGVIADLAEAVDSPRRLTDDPDAARRLWENAADLPTPVWGRDELGTGEMWNSNSVIAWLVTRSGLDAESIRPPVGGRAPGWQAGIVLAHRLQPESMPTSYPRRPSFEVLCGGRVGEGS
jgi:hypothetical protein